MTDRCLFFAAGLTALVSLAHAQSVPSAGLAKAKTTKQTWTTPRTVDGHPDLQGFWGNNNATPLERPKELAGREFLTDKELAAFKKKAAELFSSGGDAAFGDTVFNAVLANVLGIKSGFKSTDGETGDYSSVWTVDREWENRTSLIHDPPDGRLPAMTAEGQQRRETNIANAKRIPVGPEDRPLQERCITYGSPQLTAGYQSYYQLVQSPTSVAFRTEMVHDTRVIALDARPHLPPTVHQWLGDSRGRWEGDTLVVDTTNYKMKSFMGISSEKLHVTERFTRTGPDSLRYEATVDDSGTWTKPWTLVMNWRRADKPVFEYACHEGNIGMVGILAGARVEEKTAGSTNQAK